MKFKSLVAYLMSLFPELIPGRSIFVNSLPTDIGNNEFQLLLRDVYAGITIDKDIPNYRYGRFRMAIRGYNYDRTYEAIAKISKALTIHNQIIGEMEVKLMRPLNEPVGFMTSEGGYHEFYVNFHVHFGLLSENE